MGASAANVGKKPSGCCKYGNCRKAREIGDYCPRCLLKRRYREVSCDVCLCPEAMADGIGQCCYCGRPVAALHPSIANRPNSVIDHQRVRIMAEEEAKYTTPSPPTLNQADVDKLKEAAENSRVPIEALGVQDLIDEYDEMFERLTDILTRTAIALKGPEPELTMWSWHDLPEKAEALQERLRNV